MKSMMNNKTMKSMTSTTSTSSSSSSSSLRGSPRTCLGCHARPSKLLLVLLGVMAMLGSGVHAQEVANQDLVSSAPPATPIGGDGSSIQSRSDKRAKVLKYSFGLGKRAAEMVPPTSGEEATPTGEDTEDYVLVSRVQMHQLLSQCLANNENVESDSEQGLLMKRAPQRYGFGLGKRYSLGDEPEEVDTETLLKSLKRAPQRYGFGLGKRSTSEEEVMEAPEVVGKRAPQRYAFGLGKRSTDSATSGLTEKRKVQRYSFGLGKRSSDGLHRFFSGFFAPKKVSHEDWAKRQYAFGLGKR